jgi:hypothetical protein
MGSLLQEKQPVSSGPPQPDFWTRARKVLLLACGFGAGIVFRSMLAQKPAPSGLARPNASSLFQRPVLAAQAPTRPEPLVGQAMAPSLQEPANSATAQVAPGAGQLPVVQKQPEPPAIASAPTQQKRSPRRAVSPSLEGPTRLMARNVTHDVQRLTVTKQPVLAASTTATIPQQPVPLQESTPSIAETPKSIPPQVTYEAGQLTIVAENASLSDVLSSVHKSMGADIDLPASASSERVWAQLGPGPARQVLATLLSQTKLDYVIQASDVDPDGIRNVWLTPRTEAPNATSAGISNNPTFRTPPALTRGNDTDRRVLPNRLRLAEPRAVEETVIPEPPAPPTEPAPAVPPTAAADSTTMGAQPQPAAADAAAATPPQPPATSGSAASPATSAAQASEPNKPPVSSSPDQMIQTLQNMYEQRKQMQLARTPQGTN